MLGASSEIGVAVTERLAGDGYDVVGTYRSRGGAAALERLDSVQLTQCDVSSAEDIARLAEIVARKQPWSVFVSAVGRLDPVGPWESLNFDAWESSVRDNSTAQLRSLHALLPFRTTEQAHVAFFAGGGTNGPFRNYSAYCVAKVTLIKMCELLHDEIDNLNPFIVGPGFLPTKIHAPTLADPEASGAGHAKTLAFYEKQEEALDVDDVYRCIAWCVEQGRDVMGGRNVSAVHDDWDSDDPKVGLALRRSADAWRLRRAPLSSGSAAA
ncbi:MAG TPA: SDR family oxidoreductase [Plantibacter sp.]|uniref:SDR family NAD(P)-dependent oxidoreductase n=1 Tax=Plantibacter sp. TaxID=1871045 RepID=UPI002BC50905|nr:SDR family oxidoreductase [Plantibacter sp.]